MKFSSYIYKDNDADLWEFDRMSPRSVNLIVGQSSAGKSRLLASLFVLGSSAVRKSVERAGHWLTEFDQDSIHYSYELQVIHSDRGFGIAREILQKGEGPEKSTLVDRTADGFIFNDSKMPRLPADQTSIHLLADEPDIQPIWEGFARIRQRRFDKDELDKTAYFAVADHGLERVLKQNKSLDDLFRSNSPVSLTLHYLKEHFPERFNSIMSQFRGIFPSVKQCDVYRLKREEIPFETKGIVPNFSIQEKGVKNRIGLQELSSGMKKVLLILTDIASSPNGTAYLLDEYENSLGVNAIGFLPSFISEFQATIQFFITTHHPYLINEIPIKNWFLLSRTGSKVKITSGLELEGKYGKSKQKAFIQLLNDPLYSNV